MRQEFVSECCESFLSIPTPVGRSQVRRRITLNLYLDRNVAPVEGAAGLRRRRPGLANQKARRLMPMAGGLFPRLNSEFLGPRDRTPPVRLVPAAYRHSHPASSGGELG